MIHVMIFFRQIHLQPALVETNVEWFYDINEQWVYDVNEQWFYDFLKKIKQVSSLFAILLDTHVFLNFYRILQFGR